MDAEDSTEVETFYRWVSREELEDIEECGKLRLNPDGSGLQRGKWVTDTPEHAVQWGKQFDEYPDGGTVIEINTEHAKRMAECLDGIGPGFFIQKSHLGKAEVSKHETS